MGWLFSAGNPNEGKINELAALGYWDDQQNRAALEQANGDLKRAIALILEGIVPDIEQGYVPPPPPKSAKHKPRGANADFWRREFTVSKLTWGNAELHTQQQESRGVLRFCAYRDGLQAWTKNGCVWRSEWKLISSFGMSEDKTCFVLHSASKSQVGNLRVKSCDAKKIMDVVMEMAKALASEIKSKKAGGGKNLRPGGDAVKFLKITG
eukprot:SAG11_NODE_1006_length_6209_cov_3.553846_4_plen_209_part_00